MEIAPRFTLPDDDGINDGAEVRLARRKAARRFERRLVRWLGRYAGPDGLVAHHLPNGEADMVVELPMRPGRRPYKVRVIVTDYHDD
jgi:hypothetical protein